MAITPPITPVPTTVQSVTITLKDWLEHADNPAGQSINYQLVLLDQSGQRIRWPNDQGNLAPHLTPEQVVQAQAFMAAMRTLAEAVLP